MILGHFCVTKPHFILCRDYFNFAYIVGQPSHDVSANTMSVLHFGLSAYCNRTLSKETERWHSDIHMGVEWYTASFSGIRHVTRLIQNSLWVSLKNKP